jgi:hypothetical protein
MNHGPCAIYSRVMGVTGSKRVATDYSGIKKGNPMATVLAVQCGAVDRAGAMLSEIRYGKEGEMPTDFHSTTLQRASPTSPR